MDAKEYPKVSVVVLNYNGRLHLKECFESLMEQTYPDYEVIMVDNASTDGSVEYVRENFPQIKILELEKNYGFARGNNEGAWVAEGEYIAFLNNDTRTEKDWLAELVKPMKSDPSVAICGSKMMLFDRRDIINHVGGEITIIGAGVDTGLLKEDSREFNVQKYVGFACGGATLVRKSIFEQLGGFDTDYFIYFEDVDLGWRAWLYGYKVVYVPTSVVYHKFGGTVDKAIDASGYMRAFLCQKNRLANLIKNCEMSNVFKGLVVSLFYDIWRIGSFAYLRDRYGIAAVLKGYWAWITNLPGLIKKRRVIQAERKVSDRYMKEMGLIMPLSAGIKEYFRLHH